MKKYLWYSNGKKEMLTEEEAAKKKKEITAHAETLTTIPEVLQYCQQNFVQGPYEERVIEAIINDPNI